MLGKVASKTNKDQQETHKKDACLIGLRARPCQMF